MSIYETTTFGIFDDLNLTTKSEAKKDLSISPPPEFGGPEGQWSPEDLFCASISSCYLLTFKTLAEHKKIEWENIEVTASASLEKVEGGYKFTKVIISPVLTVCCQDNFDRYLDLLEKAKKFCLVTRSINAEFELNPKIKNHTKYS